MSKVTDIIMSNPANRQAAQILSGVQQAYDNADLVGSERSAITGLHQLMLSAVDNLADRARSASTDLMETMLGISILEFCDFNTKMGIFMNRLMQININEKHITLNNLGRDAMNYGLSDNITGQVLHPSYAEDINYLNFVQKVHSGEPEGRLSTQHDNPVGIAQKTESPHGFDYGNLYPDDLPGNNGRGQGAGPDFPDRKKWKWESDQNSILYKTKALFNQKKINTIISRFGTQADADSNHIYYNGSKRTTFGESHGRNLLKADAEKNGALGQYTLNGYNNPYCRVWTHHYQYNQFYKTIRPFSQVEYANGVEIPYEEDTLKKFHKWGEDFKYDRERGDKDKGYGWKNGDAGWDKSVLSLDKGGDGIVKIAPKYVNSRRTNIHTKECMFSIENLAWKGYDPYSFEKALSWEQRGPLGGRIMWFPPYGITFNETTNVNWSSNTFIGRGEDVYTYVNTMRSGTLSFLMVVDHPSVIDYASWYDDDNKATDEYTDTDLMRFFAGCDSLDPKDPRSILSRVKPTPLTDEYIANYADDPGPVQENTPPPPKEDPVVPKETKTVSFYVFYPNNYSGYYDDANFAVAYLLAGCGCQKRGAEDMKTMLGSDFTYTNLSSIFDNQTNPGYETTEHPVSFSWEGETTAQQMMKRLDEDENFIYGTAKAYNSIPKTDKKRWYYRVDGEYKAASQTATRNTYGQKIPDLNGKLTITPENTNYCDTKSFQLNSSMSNWPEEFRSDEDDNKIYCTFADFAQAVAKIKDMGKVESFLKERCAYGDIVAGQIKGIFDNYKLISVDCVGYSNSHGFNQSNKVNADRNSNLAIARGNTIIQWLNDNKVIDSNVKTNSTSQPSTPVGDADRYDHSGLNAKLWRSAKVTLTFETDVEKKLAELKQAQQEEENTVKFEKYTGYTPVEIDGKTVYKDKNGEIWIERETNGGKNHELVKEDAGRLTGVSSSMRGATQTYGLGTKSGFGFDNKGNVTDIGEKLMLNSVEKKYGARRNAAVDGDKNVYRYDQEYYFFRALKKSDPLVFNKLMDKIKYFDPAFHSMTPEGFNARLTFLNQCTRQGNTITMSDFQGRTANNLAFGRPPFCVLRIGDFYNQMIVIDNISIDYNVSNGIQWDMNTEGIGMQPLLAQINISFKFIGGGDLAGPIRRLQNAMSFNYYANTRLYDNRADRIRYKSEDNWKEIGGAGNHEVDLASRDNYAYITEPYKTVKK